MSQSPLSQPLPWDLVAGAYEAEIAPAFETYARAALRLAAVPQGGTLADVGCGPGTLTCVARDEGYAVRAVDFSPDMVARCRARLGDAAGPKVEVEVGDGQALPFADASVDAAFSLFALFFFPDRTLGLRELRRVVRPGGVVVVSSWHPMDAVPQFASLFDSLRELRPDLPPGAPGALGDEATIRAEFAEAGLPEVQVQTVVHALEADDAGAFSDGMTRTLAPLVLTRHSLRDAWSPFCEALREKTVERLGPGPVRAVLPAWTSVARLPS
jgi:SAM-dependent methyltransferase